jgi:glycosyltransferase involved in cell wall biosynthesis
MKILQVTALYPPHIGGIEKHVSQLSQKLVELGHQVTVYTSNVPKSKEYEIINGVHVYRFKSLCSPLNNQITPGLFFKLISKNDFDIVHVHSQVHFSSNITVLSNIGKTCPIVLTSHGIAEYKEGWKKIVNVLHDKTITKWMFKSVDKIIALSVKHQEALGNLGADLDKMEIISNWVDMRDINCNVDITKFIKLYRLEDKKIILYVGGLIPRKGINYLITAMNYVDKDVILLVVGSEMKAYEGVKESLEKQVKDLGLNNVFFMGSLNKEDLDCAYSAADIVVLPSINEIFGLVILEAMAYGKCVVASNVSGPSSIIEDHKSGLLFEAGNSLQLADKINYLFSNPQILKDIGQNAKSMVEYKYNIDTSVEKVINIYNEVSQRRGLKHKGTIQPIKNQLIDTDFEVTNMFDYQLMGK